MLKEKLNQLGYSKIKIVYGYKCEDGFRVYADFAEKDWTFFEFDKRGNVIYEAGILPDSKRLTESEKAKIIEIVLSEEIPRYRDVYIRFGELPKGAKSKNYATGEYESGISAFDARYDIAEAAFEICGTALVGAAISGLLADKKIYLLNGEESGTGSDGEPTIKNVEIIGELGYDNNGYFYLKSEV